MKKFIYLALSFHLMSFSFGSELRDAACEKEGSLFGNGSGKDRIPEDCLQSLSTKTNSYTHRKSVDEKFSVLGHKNIIFLKDPNSKIKGQNVISGKFTELEEVTALAIDEVHKEIAVIDRGRDVFLFSSEITGNVAPLRVIRSEDLEGSVDLVVNPKKNQLIFLNPTTREILFFSRLANSLAPQNKKKTEVLKRIGKIDGEHLTLDVRKQELHVISLEKGVILAWNLEDFSVRRINFEKPSVEVKSVTFSQEEEKIHLETDKKTIKLSVR